MSGQIHDYDNIRSLQNYWSKMGQLKFDLFYYSFHFELCILILRSLHIGTAVITAAAAGAWMGWNSVGWIKIVCPIVILALQVLNVGVELLPYDNRKQELRDLIGALEPLYNKVERDWSIISYGDLGWQEIEEKVFSFRNENSEIAKNYFKNDSLPQVKHIIKRAKTAADNYMRNLS